MSCHFHISKKKCIKKKFIAQKSIQQFFRFHFLPSEGTTFSTSNKNLWYQILVLQETFPFLVDPENRPCENDKTQDT